MKYPSNWTLKSIGEVTTIGSGKDYKHLGIGDVPVYGTGGVMTYVDSYLYDGESVGIGRKGTIDKPQFLKGKFWTVDTLFYTHSFIGATPKFLYYLFSSINWKLYNEASGVPSLSKKTIETIDVLIPPLPEQQKIAAILSKWDELIESQTKLIEAKEKQKTSLMQKLLTGEVRFPGFEDEWEDLELNDILDKIVGGGTPSRLNPSYWNGEIFWCTVKDFTNFNPNQTQETITENGLKVSASNLIPKGTLITPTRMAIGKIAIFNVDVAINQDLKALYLNKKANNNFLYQWFNFQSENISNLGTGSTVMGIKLEELRSIKISLPSMNEQEKIANTLSYFDIEIQTLKDELESYKLQKKGLMQQLLTGKIRVKN